MDGVVVHHNLGFYNTSGAYAESVLKGSDDVSKNNFLYRANEWN